MATPIQITLADVKLGRMYIEKIGSDLQLFQEYVFVNGQGVEVPDIGTKVFEINVPIAEIPSSILSALQTIQTHVYNQILASKGMT